MNEEWHDAVDPEAFRLRDLITGVVLGFCVTAGILLLGGIVGLVHVDHYPALDTYGVSIGTNSNYCSFELVDWHPVASCDSAS